jgi:hypothetical protein
MRPGLYGYISKSAVVWRLAVPVRPFARCLPSGNLLPDDSELGPEEIIIMVKDPGEWQ